MLANRIKATKRRTAHAVLRFELNRQAAFIGVINLVFKRTAKWVSRDRENTKTRALDKARKVMYPNAILGRKNLSG